MSILYVSDEWLDSGVRGENNSFDAIPIATNAANSNTVSVFAHLVETSRSLSLLSSSPSIADHYKLISESTTGGAAYIGEKPTAELYIDLVADAACNCGGGCIEVENPEIKPCISISWGDSDCDNLETEDFEKLCISVCNCYSNVTFSNLTIAYVYISNADGSPVSNLPNGTPSIEAIPLGPICFGDIKPCVDGKETCVSREFVIKSCGAKAGEYKIELGSICYEVTLYYREKACFNFELCDS